MSDAVAGVRIFINYRRDDTSGHAGRLYDSLIEEFGEGAIFMDIDTIDPGEDFVQVIHEGVGSCDVVLSLIGRGWLASKDARARRRLDNPEDFVRLELETALDRGIRIIPLLVQGAVMPSSEDLPDTLAGLARRNALDLSDGRWAYDVGRLVKAIERVASQKASRFPPPPPPEAPTEPLPPPLPPAARPPLEPPSSPIPSSEPSRPSGGRRVRPPVAIGAALLAVVLIGGTVFLLTRDGRDPGTTPTTPPATTPPTTVPPETRTEAYRADFGADLTGWQPTENADCSWQPIDGAYRITVISQDHLCWSTTAYDAALSWADTSVEVDEAFVSGATAADAEAGSFAGGAQGVICRRVADTDSDFYYGEFHANGDWRLRKYGAEAITLAQGNVGSLTSSRNAIRLDCVGGSEVRLVLSVNGTPVGEAVDGENPYAVGAVGMIVSTPAGESNYSIDFDNLVAYEVTVGG